MDTQTAASYLVALGLGAVIVEITRSLLNRKQMGANAAKTLTDAAVQLLNPLRERIVALEATVETTQQRLIEAQARLAETQSRLTEAHATLERTVARLEVATHELEHLRARVQKREDVLDERDARDEEHRQP